MSKLRVKGVKTFKIMSLQLDQSSEFVVNAYYAMSKAKPDICDL